MASTAVLTTLASRTAREVKPAAGPVDGPAGTAPAARVSMTLREAGRELSDGGGAAANAGGAISDGPETSSAGIHASADPVAAGPSPSRPVSQLTARRNISGLSPIRLPSFAW